MDERAMNVFTPEIPPELGEYPVGVCPGAGKSLFLSAGPRVRPMDRPADPPPTRLPSYSSMVLLRMVFFAREYLTGTEGSASKFRHTLETMAKTMRRSERERERERGVKSV